MIDAKVDLSVLEAFRGACLEYENGMEAVLGALKSELANMGDSWRDEDFGTISWKTEDLAGALETARMVVSEELRPFVEKKMAQLASK